MLSRKYLFVSCAHFYDPSSTNVTAQVYLHWINNDGRCEPDCRFWLIAGA